MDNQEARQRVQKKAKVKVEFRIHLIIYIAVITLLAIINLLITPGYIWFKWPLLGWSIAVIIHALSVFNGSTNSNIKERMIEEEMKKEN